MVIVDCINATPAKTGRASEQAIAVRELEPVTHHSLEHDYLMPNCSVLPSSRHLDLGGEFNRLRKRNSRVAAFKSWVYGYTPFGRH
jgi:hypothetical protein